MLLVDDLVEIYQSSFYYREFYSLSFVCFKRFDRCHTCNLSRDKIACVTSRVAQLLNSRATPFPNRAVYADWFMQQSCSVRHAQLHTATLSHDKVAPQNRAIKLQM